MAAAFAAAKGREGEPGESAAADGRTSIATRIGRQPRALTDRALGPRAETRRSPSFRISDKQKCRTADYLRSTCWPASRRHRADNVESEAVAAKSLPGGTFGIARLASLQVTPIESACKYAESRDNNDDHDGLCRHRTNSIWFIDAIKRNSLPPGFDLDQTECRKFNTQPWRSAASRLLAIVCHRGTG